MNEKRLRKLKGWKGVVALVVIGLGTLYELVHFLEAIDFVMEFMHRPVVRLILEWSQHPGIVLVFILLGFLWLSFILRSEDEESEQEPLPLPPVALPAPAVRERVVVKPVRVREPEPPADPPPNIVVLECNVLPVEVDEYGRILTSNNPTAAAAIVTFRNDVVAGKRVGYMNHTRAHLRIEPKGSKTLHVNSGCWLKSEFNTIDIGPGDSPQLVLAASALEDNLKMATPDDHREDVDHYEPPKGVGYEAEEAEIHVKLVGGWEAQYVSEFRFRVRRTPTLSVEHLA